MADDRAGFTIFGGFLTGVGSLLYWNALRSIWKAQYIERTPATKLEEIEEKFKSMNAGQSLTLKVYGNVDSENPIACELAKDNQKVAIYQRLWLGKWYSFNPNANNDFLIQKSFITSNLFIHDNKQHRLYVQPWQDNPKLSLIHEDIQEGKNFLLSMFFSYFSIPFPYKYLNREEILPLGSSLLCVGKVYKSHDGKLTLKQANSNFFTGVPYSFVTRETEEDVLDELRSSSFTSTVLGTIFTLPGLGMLGYGTRRF